MNYSTLYCPKCGNELISLGGDLNKCQNPSCDYLIQGFNTIDISFKSKGIAKALSNLCPYSFKFDNVYCYSMEAFIQSLKVKNTQLQRELCAKTGPFCYGIRTMFDDWRIKQQIYWKGRTYNRHSKDYILLLKRAYIALYEQSEIFSYAINKVKKENYTLIHSVGCTDSNETLLTPDEYMDILYYLIENIE